jgi:RHS repeat-associated protein
MPGSAVMGGSNKNLYNGGSEWQSDYQNLPDYYRTYYRNYDAALGRFMSVDPKAESAESMTGYQYANNNPIMNNDPMGDEARYSKPPAFIPFFTHIYDPNSIQNGMYNGSDSYGPSNNHGGGNGMGTSSIITVRDESAQQSLATNVYIYNDGRISIEPSKNGVSYFQVEGEDGSWYTIFQSANQGGQDPIKGIHVIYESETPTIYRNTLNALKNGLPYILHYEPSLISANRANMLKGYPAVSRSVQRDEYPYASTREGGNGMVFYVPGSENSLQGQHLMQLYSTLQPGDAFLVFLIPRGQEPENELAPNSNPIQISPVVTAGAAAATIITFLTWVGRLAF